jgi:uncharacterized protein YxeA
MKKLLIALIATSTLTLSVFANPFYYYQQDNRGWEEFLYQQELQNRLDEINAKLNALDNYNQQLDDYFNQ